MTPHRQDRPPVVPTTTGRNISNLVENWLFRSQRLENVWRRCPLFAKLSVTKGDNDDD
jgi:hypothetical protein